MTRWVLAVERPHLGWGGAGGRALLCPQPFLTCWAPPVPLSPESSTTARGTVAPAHPPAAVRSLPRPMRRMCASFTKVRGTPPARSSLEPPLLPSRGVGSPAAFRGPAAGVTGGLAGEETQASTWRRAALRKGRVGSWSGLLEDRGPLRKTGRRRAPQFQECQ